MPNIFSKKHNFTLGLLTMVGLAITSPAMAGSMYAITDLGKLSPDGVDTRANAINNKGQVTGRSRIGSGTPNSGFIWENGVINALPLTGIKNGTDIVTMPGRGGLSRSINESGTIIGAGDELPGPTDRALLWSPNSLGGYDLEIFDFGGIESYFQDINNQNQIAGYHIFAAGKRNAIFWENGTRINLPGLDGDQNTALALNDKLQIVGYVDTDGADNGTNTNAAALWQKDSNGNFVLTNLGSLGAAQSFARNINILGEVIGQLTNPGSSSPFIWQNGITTNLGSLGGTVGNALSINKNTQVVGTSNTANGDAHAFLWDDGELFDLNNLLVNGTGWQLRQATGINDHGQIVGYGLYTNADGTTETRAFLLQSVPESNTIVGLLAIGILGLVKLRQSKF